MSARERRALGKSLRASVPRSSHGEWSPPADRFDPVSLIDDQNETRLPWLVPVRHGRMGVSPFTFYRGAARIMAADLAASPTTGIGVQACGDAHLSNFGVFASPERRLVFDINDFDETLAGPWEWDVKRLATSVMIAAQHRDFGRKTCEKVTRGALRAYREAMADLARKRTLDVWYAHLPIEELFALVEPDMGAKRARRAGRFVAKARSRDSLHALSKLTEVVDGRYRIKSDPPLLLPHRDLPHDLDSEELDEVLRDSFANYVASLADNRQHLLGRFRPVEGALKIVGVGSVGTRCSIVLLEGCDQEDVLFLQITDRFREEFVPVFDQWVSLDPRNNPDAPLSPFALDDYRVSELEESVRLGEEADALVATSAAARVNAENYTIALVLFAMAIFFASIAMRFASFRTRIGVLAFGIVLFVAVASWMSSLPKSVAL